jgi:hypothetical protein
MRGGGANPKLKQPSYAQRLAKSSIHSYMYMGGGGAQKMYMSVSSW